MNIKFITYDLHGKEKNYDELIQAIKSEGSWWHYLESFWIIETEKNTEELNNQLIKFLDEDDRLFVFDVASNNYNGFLPQKAYDWIKNRYDENGIQRGNN